MDIDTPACLGTSTFETKRRRHMVYFFVQSVCPIGASIRGIMLMMQ